MADNTTANLEGANEKLNKFLTDATIMKDKLIAKHGADASAIKSDLESLVTDVQSSIQKMIPELPDTPNVSAQAEFAALKDIDITTTAGKKQYDAKVAEIKSKFGDTLESKGIDVDTIAKDIQSGAKDIGDSIPNLQLPDGETVPIELPSNISFPSIEALKEKLETMPEFKISIGGLESGSEDLKSKVKEALDALDEATKKENTESKLTEV
jgi:hypothetical protein